ncbi:acetate and butyrate kinase [Schizophyllum commune H4-8]|uniref:acetate and butyrate kinase n=1 Tax=Schizophyllum commune (strain H4-8 / FGSC 9210) TaxID=578458 RepID=UPI00215FC35D|nr:acetate and butyrate kinase [Schizophyllum commune H4-8]KAI5890477.1 acetate and butyrate kinase [Schizophyllum commune H4-8]
MDKLILSANSGSSSLKISLYALASEGLDEPVGLLLQSSISNISAPPAKFTFKTVKGTPEEVDDKVEVDGIDDHASAFEHFLKHLKDAAGIERGRISHVCHRVVHGGDYRDPVELSSGAYHHIERLSDLAPLHNGAALSVIQGAADALPGVKSIAFFDTAFHRTIPPYISAYPVDQTVAKQRGLKKYGFHGLSYSYILRAVSQHLQKPASSLNLILMHLGSGASICCIQNGRSLDTSMGLTPLSGLPGATRAGAVDPSLIFHYTNKAGRITHEPSAAVDLRVTQAEDILNTKSGWKALCGTTDFGEVIQKAFAAGGVGKGKSEGSEPAYAPGPDLLAGDPSSEMSPELLAFSIFVDRIQGYLGSYFLKLQGNVDAVVFSGGIGEKSQELRKVLCDRITCLGFRPVSEERNAKVDEKGGAVVEIGEEETGKRRLLVCRTDEQLEMARQCALNEKFW